jgi:hypothetical protein
MELRFRYKKIQDMADRVGTFLSLCQQTDQIHSFLREQLVRDNAPAFAMLLPGLASVMKEWMRQLDEMQNDLTYRERALRAEKMLRERPKP